MNKPKIRTQVALDAINENHDAQVLRIGELEATLKLQNMRIESCLKFMRLAMALADSFGESNLNAVVVKNALPDWAAKEFQS